MKNLLLSTSLLVSFAASSVSAACIEDINMPDCSRVIVEVDAPGANYDHSGALKCLATTYHADGTHNTIESLSIYSDNVTHYLLKKYDAYPRLTPTALVPYALGKILAVNISAAAGRDTEVFNLVQEHGLCYSATERAEMYLEELDF